MKTILIFCLILILGGYYNSAEAYERRTTAKSLKESTTDAEGWSAKIQQYLNSRDGINQDRYCYGQTISIKDDALATLVYQECMQFRDILEEDV